VFGPDVTDSTVPACFNWGIELQLIQTCIPVTYSPQLALSIGLRQLKQPQLKVGFATGLNTIINCDFMQLIIFFPVQLFLY